MVNDFSQIQIPVKLGLKAVSGRSSCAGQASKFSRSYSQATMGALSSYTLAFCALAITILAVLVSLATPRMAQAQQALEQCQQGMALVADNNSPPRTYNSCSVTQNGGPWEMRARTSAGQFQLCINPSNAGDPQCRPIASRTSANNAGQVVEGNHILDFFLRVRDWGK